MHKFRSLYTVFYSDQIGWFNTTLYVIGWFKHNFEIGLLNCP